MNFLRNLFTKRLDGEALVHATERSQRAQIELLASFDPPRARHDELEKALWSRTLPSTYDETLALFVNQKWLDEQGEHLAVTPEAQPFVDGYRARLEREREAIMPRVRQALVERDTSEALDIRRRYESEQPLGKAAWTGPDPQMSHSALTRRILFLDHPLLHGLSRDAVDWLKLYAAEQHLWGTHWRLDEEQIPPHVRTEIVGPQHDAAGMNAVEVAYWRARELMLLVENQETWQRCKGGDHVRRIAVVAANDAELCEHCRQYEGKQYLVVRVPELPHVDCTSPRGCRCRYEPVLESYSDLEET